MSIVANNHSLDRTEFACNCNVVTGDVVTTSSETAKEGGRWVVSGRNPPACATSFPTIISTWHVSCLLGDLVRSLLYVDVCG
jgi:hypothetical protein